MSFFRDLNAAFHSLMRSKGLATVVVLTLALGIGANAAIFTHRARRTAEATFSE
jgi:putative ABC transport system permease protein